MIVRSWRARATAANARSYVAFFHRHLRPVLAQFAGHKGALVLTRADEVVVDKAVVEPEAKSLLLSFDPVVQHHHCALDTRFERATTQH